MISLCIPKYPNISEKISQSDILMLSPLSLAPYPTPPGPSSSPRRADAADLRPGASAANDGCRCCCKPGPAAAGAAASLGPQPALQQAWARSSRRRCGPGAGECRNEPDQPKTGSDNQEDIYPDINGYKWIKFRIQSDKI